MKTTGAFDLLITILLMVIYVVTLLIKNESKEHNTYLKAIEQQNHKLLLYKEKESGLQIDYIDSTNTYVMKPSELFKP